MLIHLINLQRTGHRLREFLVMNGSLGLTLAYFPAIDGHALDVPALIERGIIKREILETYTAGHLGNALSHLAIWRKAIETNEVITVCEDDAVFNHDFASQAETILSQVRDDWDFILWGWNFDAAIMFDLLPGVSRGVLFCEEDQLRQSLAEFQAQSYLAHPVKLLQGFGLLAYSVSPKGARALTEACTPLRQLLVPLAAGTRNLQNRKLMRNVGLDVAMSHAYPQLQAFVSLPPLVVSKNEKSGSASDEECLAKMLSNKTGRSPGRGDRE